MKSALVAQVKESFLIDWGGGGSSNPPTATAVTLISLCE